MAAPGVVEQERLHAAGVTPQQIEAWRNKRAADLAAIGATDEQIAAYFGRGPVQTAAPDQFVAAEFAEPAEGEPKQAKGFADAIRAGYQASLTGLGKRGRLPDIVIGDESGFLEAVTAGIVQGVGDLPVSVPTFFAGAPIGAKAGAVAGGTVTRTPAGAAAGAVTGALFSGGAVSGFVTEGTREAYMEFLRQNENAGVEATPRDFAARIMAAVLRQETLGAASKGAAVGAAASVAGGPLTRGALSGIKSTAAREIIVTGAETAAAVGVTSAIEGELPEARDFATVGAILVGTKTGAAAVSRGVSEVKGAQERLQKHYATTGEKPAKALERAKADPVFRQEIVAGDNNVSRRAIVREGPEGRIVFDSAKIGDEAATAAKDATTDHSAVVEAAIPRPRSVESAPAEVNEAVAAARANLRAKVKPTKVVGRTAAEQVDWLRYQYVNDLQYMVSESRGAVGGKLAITENPGELARLAFGAHAKAELAIKDGVYTPDGKTKIVDGFEPILKRLPKDQTQNFLDYAIAKRVVEKTKQGFETGFDALDADLIAKTGDADPAFRKAFEDLQVWQNTMIDRLVDAGLVSKDGAAAMKDANRSYVPWARVMDEGKAPAGVTARGLPVRRATKKFEGSERDIFNPFEVMVKNRYALQQLADNNVARRRLVEFNNALPEDQRFLKPAKKQITATELAASDKQLAEFLKDNGLDPEDLNGLMVYRAANKRLAEGEFIVFEDGKAVTYKADNPDLVLSLQSLDRKALGTISKILAVPSSFLRTGTTTDPAFILKSAIRDQLGSVLVNSFKVLPIVDAAVGMAHIVGKSSAMRRWIEAGGANSALLSLDRQILGDLLARDKVQLPLTNAWNAVTTPYRLMAAASTLAENSLRVGRFVRAEKTKSQEAAALESRDVALDFARMGANVRAFNMISAWTGATINGLDRTVLAFKNDPVGTFAKTAALVTFPSLMLWWANRDKEWYKELEDWEKAVFWHIDTGGTDSRGSPIVLRIPMPQQFGPLFGFLPVALIEEYGKTDSDFDGALSEALKVSVPGVDDFVPVLLSPLFEIGANYNYFTEAPLVSESLQRQLPEYRYTPYTTETSKAVAKMIAPFSGGLVEEKFTTPIAMEYLIRQYTGSVGINTLKVVDAGLRKAGVLDDPAKPSQTFSDLPVVGGFFLRAPQGKRSISDFYENAERLDQIKATLREQVKRGNSAEAQRILDLYGAPVLNPAKTREALSNLRQTAIGVHYHPDIPAEEKRQLIDDLTFAQTQVARAFNEAYTAARQAEKGLK